MVKTELFCSRKEQTSSETENSMTQRAPMIGNWSSFHLKPNSMTIYKIDVAFEATI